MSGLDIADDHLQPASFVFNDASLARAQVIIAKYPEVKKQSAVMPLLDLAQRQHEGWIPRAAIEYIADLLEMPSIRVWEVATFYTMYYLAPKGKHKVQVCTTTPCWLRGSDDVVTACKSNLGIGFGEVTADGMFSLHEVECLGACVNAPMIQIDDDYYEDLDKASTERILDAFKAGQKPEHGPQNGRRGSEPAEA
ncbi:MAG: NADH-quinone oxidoreductase subunit NuoE [Alphaproteobacteria bacterium]|jgi:NADH-quinone oxidoreductase E subunit